MIDFDGSSVRLPDGVLLDLGATAKAVAADRCAHRVYAETGSGVLVNLGGDLTTAGPAPDGGWVVLVQDTDDDPHAASHWAAAPGWPRRARAAGSGGTMAIWCTTSSTRAPDAPPSRCGAVSASPHRDCLTANALSTAAIIRGRRAPDWIAGLGIPARFVDQAAPCAPWEDGRRDDKEQDDHPTASTGRAAMRGPVHRTLPELLTRDDWGYPLSRNGSREPVIPPNDLKYAKAAVKRCPRLALQLLTTDVDSETTHPAPSSHLRGF